MRAWLLVLLNGDVRARPRSHASIYVYFAAVQPLIEQWSAGCGHLREVTAADINAVLDPLRGHQLRTTTAVHAARWAAIRDLTLDDPGLPNRRITIAGHRQRLGELTYRALRAWLDYRRATWPRTPSRHVLISGKTALGSGPVTRSFLSWNLQRHGVSIERIRRDRVLREALTARADPLHLALVFGLSRTPPASTRL